MLSPGTFLYAARPLLGWWFKQDTAHFFKLIVEELNRMGHTVVSCIVAVLRLMLRVPVISIIFSLINNDFEITVHLISSFTPFSPPDVCPLTCQGQVNRDQPILFFNFEAHAQILSHVEIY
jgi:hypothetical protein